MTNYWWESKGSDRAKKIAGIVEYIDNEQAYKRDANLRFMRLYGSVPILGLNTTHYSRVASSALPAERYTFNVIRSSIDTLTNKIAKNKIKVSYLTDGGVQSAQRRAKQLQKYSAGMFKRTKAREHMIDAFRDALVSGNGWVKVYSHEGRVMCERVFFDFIKWDDRDAENGKPSSLFQVRIVKRDIAARMFPNKREEIMQCPSVYTRDQGSQFTQYLADSIYLYEAWHLPSLPGEKDGVHTICTENAELTSDRWTRSNFPFLHLQFSKRLIGFGGTSMTELLASSQLELNRTMAKIQQAMNLSAPKVIVQAGANAVKSKIDNTVGGILEVQDAASVQYIAPQPIDQSFFLHKQSIIQEGYDQAGISQLAAQSKKPDGLDSGKALREFNDIESERFMMLGQQWEEAHVQLMDLMIQEQKELYEAGTDSSEKVDAGSFIESINWSDVDMDRDSFVIKAFPTSYLSSTPAGRLTDVKDLMQLGIITDPQQAAALLDFPDLDQFYKGKNAVHDFVGYVLERITDFGEYMAPDPKMPLEQMMPAFYDAYLNGRREGMEQERLDMLQAWMLTADQILKQRQQQMMAEQQAMMQQQAAAMPQQPGPSGAV
jgi:hypothetical protein